MKFALGKNPLYEIFVKPILHVYSAQSSYQEQEKYATYRIKTGDFDLNIMV